MPSKPRCEALSQCHIETAFNSYSICCLAVFLLLAAVYALRALMLFTIKNQAKLKLIAALLATQL